MLGRIASLVLLCVGLWTGQSFAQSPQPEPALAALLVKARARAAEYQRVFRDLTATETQTTEVFKPDGKLEKQRQTVADFLVYPSRFDANLIHECRVFSAVDGKPVNTSEKRLQRFFTQLAQAKSKQQEFAQIKEQNIEHFSHYYRFNQTTSPAWVLKEGARYDFTWLGREQVAGHETVVVAYRSQQSAPIDGKSLFAREVSDEFKQGVMHWRGRLWLDAQTGDLWRMERDYCVEYAGTAAPLIAFHDWYEFAPSPYGIPLPQRIVTEWNFNERRAHDGQRELRLRCRFTDEYTAFKRFTATVQEDETRRVVK